MALLARASANIFQISNNRYAKLTLNSVRSKLDTKYPAIVVACERSSVNARTVHTNVSYEPKRTEAFVPFEELVARRRDEASRSILVQVQSVNSCPELHAYCTQFGIVKGMHHYAADVSKNFVLVEFQKTSDVKSILSETKHLNVQQVIPVHSPILWFRASRNHTKLSVCKDVPLLVTHGTAIPTNRKINQALVNAKSLTDQMVILHNAVKLNDIATRLRFLTARQIELFLSGMFPNVAVLPFGSSVNGFGRLGCDLDLVLNLETTTLENEDCRLVYHAKELANERTRTQKLMENIGDTMQQCLPGISHVRRILQARVPIIKYNQTFTGLECDLSMSNMTAIHMSELLCLYGEIDERVRPLTFTVRRWAQEVGLTNSTPGRWISNFSLSLLVLFYLQQKNILPNLNKLTKLASKDDVRFADDVVNCTFLRDISRLPKTQMNTNSLGDLLHDFFEYYSNFDFAKNAISLSEGSPICKPERFPLYIINPLERSLNVSKNVSIEELERLRIELRNAAWLLESASENKSESWGLLSVFKQRVQNPTFGCIERKRMMNVTTLFNETESGKTSSQMATSAINNSSSIEGKRMMDVTTLFDETESGKTSSQMATAAINNSSSIKMKKGRRKRR